MEQWIIDARNQADAYYNYGMTVNPGPIENSIPQARTYEEPAPRDVAPQSIYETPVWQAPAEEESEARQYIVPRPAPVPAYRTPAERLSDCAYTHDCGGEFAQ